jgi:hypothetical protein
MTATTTPRRRSSCTSRASQSRSTMRRLTVTPGSRRSISRTSPLPTRAIACRYSRSIFTARTALTASPMAGGQVLPVIGRGASPAGSGGAWAARFASPTRGASASLRGSLGVTEAFPDAGLTSRTTRDREAVGWKWSHSFPFLFCRPLRRRRRYALRSSRRRFCLALTPLARVFSTSAIVNGGGGSIVPSSLRVPQRPTHGLYSKVQAVNRWLLQQIQST